MALMIPKTIIMPGKIATSFKNDVRKVMTQNGVSFDISEEDITDSCDDCIDHDFTIGEYEYAFTGRTYENVSKYEFSVIRTKIVDNAGDAMYRLDPVLFNDITVETADLIILDKGKISFGYCWLNKYKKNACLLCSNSKTFKCCRTHEKSQKHIKNVLKRNKLYTDTIADTTKLNADVCMLITSYLF